MRVCRGVPYTVGERGEAGKEWGKGVDGLVREGEGVLGDG